MPKRMRMSNPKSRFFMALACDQRIKILELLRHKEMCSCELVPALEIDQSVVSRHLSLLREVGMIEGHKQGVNIYYTIGDKRILQILDLSKEMLRDLFEKQQQFFSV